MPAATTHEKVRRCPERREGVVYVAPAKHCGQMAHRLARRLGKSDKSAQRDLERVRETLAHVAAIVNGDPTLTGVALELIAAVSNATAIGRVPTLDPLMVHADHRADLAEDEARLLWVANRTRESLLRWRTAKARSQGTGKTVLVAMGEELAK